MKALLVLTLSLISTLSVAQTTTKELSALELHKAYYASNCEEQCDGAMSVEPIDYKHLSAPHQQHLSKMAFSQAQIWGDTILEGEFVADGNVRLDQVLVIKENFQVIGYAITYSERAWYVGNCDYVHQQPETLVGCDEGRIQERSFVATNLREAEVDENKFADFFPKD